MAVPVATQLVQYENDGVEVSYSNGARLNLAPCAASFTYHQPAGEGQHPLLGERTIEQRTIYTISTFRDQVREAVNFRNMFAQRPYVCKELLDPGSINRLHVDLSELRWPSAPGPSDIETLADGSLRLMSTDKYAAVTMAPSQQLLTVRYTCKIGQLARRHRLNNAHSGRQQTLNNTGTSPNSTQEISKISHIDTTAAENTATQGDSVQSEAAILDEGRWDYSWVTRHFSVHSIPDCWKQPCQVLVQFAKRNSNSVQFEDDDPEILDTKSTAPSNDKKSYFHIMVPQALPVNCSASHMHKTTKSSRKQATGTELGQTSWGRLKVVCCQGIIYRFINTNGPCVEIYPGDGSVLRSSGLAGHFFIHYIHKNGKVEERVHSVLHAPPDIRGTSYSVAKLISRGARFLEHLCEQNLNLQDSGSPACWQLETQSPPFKTPLASVLLEECTVDGVGRFTAHSSGRVRILFTDRTALDMIADLGPRFNRCKKHSNGIEEYVDIQTYKNQTIAASHLSDLPEGMCRLLLTNGQYHYVCLSSPGQYHRYTEAAVEWVNWVNTSPADRHSFYKDTIHDSDKLSAIEQEIKKIRCFNYLLENKVMSQVPVGRTATGISDQPTKPYTLLQERTSEHMTTRKHPNTDSRPLATAVMTTEMPAGYCRLSMDSANHLTDTRSVPGSADIPGALKQSSMMSDGQEVSFHSVQEVLRQTSLAIKDLDQFLGQNGETEPVRDLN